MSHFFAFISRLKLIQRWSLMRSQTPENVAEHSLQVAQVAHCLALYKQQQGNTNINPDRIAVLSLYHDASEVLTGDLPTPIKYANDDISQAFQQVEATANKQLIGMLPESLRPTYQTLLTPTEADGEQRKVVKMADTLCAYLKCQEELAHGNHEFETAAQSLMQRLCDYEDDAVNWFIETFSKSFSASLDDMRVTDYHAAFNSDG